MSEARSWSKPPLCAVAGGQDGSSLGSWAVGRGRGREIRLAHWLPGKLAEGHAPHRPFEKLSGKDGQI